MEIVILIPEHIKLLVDKIPIKDIITILIPILFGLWVRHMDNKRQEQLDFLNQLREYYRYNIKPAITQILKDSSNRKRAYIYLIDSQDKQIDILQYHENTYRLIVSLSTHFFPFLIFSKNTRYKQYYKRIISYHYLINYIIDIYVTTFNESIHNGKLKEYSDFVVVIDMFLSCLELILFVVSEKEGLKIFNEHIAEIEIKIKKLELKNEVSYLFNKKDYDSKMKSSIK